MPVIEGKIFGRFRHLLLPDFALQAEARLMHPKLEQLAELYQRGKIPDALYALLFVLCFTLQRMVGHNWKEQRRNRPWVELFLFSEQATTRTKEICQNLRKYHLRGLPGFVLPRFADWLQGQLNVCLTETMVTPEQMLAAQAKGFRYITLALPQAMKGEKIGNRDALEFLLHDLAHADTFFRLEYDPAGQQHFFACLQKDLPLLQPIAQTDVKFRQQLEYLMSDMNSHPQHLRQYLKAVLFDFYGRRGSPHEVDQLLGLLSSLR